MAFLKNAWGKISSGVQNFFSGETEKTKSSSESSHSSQTETKNSTQRLSDAVREKSKLLSQKESLSVYKIPLKGKQIDVTGCKLYSFGKEALKKTRTIMVLGATGAGKSTLINGMINYILGVEWDFQYRFKLVTEEQTKSQAESQTSEVTVYKINHQEGFKIDYSVTIVDTPGFGDTRGIERDREIVEQLRNLFSSDHGVREIDAVCFVAQASLARLTPSQKYVFDSVLSIFGKDIAENIRILVTFADGQCPPVLEAIKASGVPCPKTEDGQPVHFKFNNSALFATNTSPAADSMGGDDEEGSFDKMFWNMGTKSMKRFFNALNLIQTKSLTMTKEVLKERQQLEVSVEGLQIQVKLGLAKLEEIKETAEKIKEFEAEISRNENFEFEITVKKPFQVDISGSGVYLTNCQLCHFTCHDDCAFANDKDKIKCCAMGSDGKCKVCPGKCIWSVHFNQRYKWEYKDVTEKQTLTELKKKYDVAKEAKSPVEALIVKLEAEYKAVQAEVEKLIEQSTKCLNRLKEIALRPNPLSTPEYIDMLIEGEKNEAKPGWNKRVHSLQGIRNKALTMAKVASGEKLLQSPPIDLFDKPKQNKKHNHDRKTTQTNSKKQKNTGTDCNKNLNERDTNANQDNTEIPKDNKSDTNQKDSGFNTNTQDSITAPDSNQDQANLSTNTCLDTYCDTKTVQDEGDEDTNKDKVSALDMVQDNDQGDQESNQSQDSNHDSDPDNDQSDHDSNQSQDSNHDTDPDKDQGDQESSKGQDIYLDTDQDDFDTTINPDSDHHADPDKNQDNQCPQKDTDSYLDLEPHEDQGDDKSNKEQIIYLDSDQSDHSTTCIQDSDHHTDPDQ